VQGIVHRLRYRRHILDGDRGAASAPRVLDARRYRDRDVAASIVTAAGAHTLDVWRYLIPAVPMWASCCPYSLSNWPKRSHACGGANRTTRDLSCAENASASPALKPGLMVRPPKASP